jgi:hypothetical protein
MKHVIGWFLKGFALVVILVILAFAISMTNPGLAQMITNPNANGMSAPASASQTGRTDNPAGEGAQPGVSGMVGPNNQNSSVGQGMNGMTDDLLGRSQVPLAQVDIPETNNIETGKTSTTLAIHPEGAGIDSSSPLIIPAADFRSDGFDPSSPWFSFWGGYQRGGNINTCLMAPAYLPNNVTVYDIYASVMDNDPAANIWIDLYRVDNYTGIVDVMAQMWTDNAYASPDIISLEDYPIDYPIVEYPTYSYYVGACLSSGSVQLYSVRLWFTP